MPHIKDIDSLNELISEEWSEWIGEVTVTQQMINEFAETTGDHQWIHVDEERAKAGPFGTTIAHGFLTLSLVPQFAYQMGPSIEGVMGGLNYGGDKYRFLAPVTVGSTVRARSRVTSVQQKSSGVLMKREVEIAAVGNDTPALVVETLTLLLG